MRNYSQKYVSKEMGISQNAYSKIENNLTQLTVTHVKQLSTILDIPPLDLLRDEFEIRKPSSILKKDASRKEVLLYLHDLQHAIKLKKEDQHIFYHVVLTLLQTSSDLVEDIR